MVAADQDQAGGLGPNHRRRRLDVRVVPHRRRSPLRVRDWRIRTKLAAVLIVPSVAFLVLASVQTGSLFGQASALDQFAAQVGVGREITDVLRDLQQERNRTAGELAGLTARGARRTDAEQLQVALRPLYGDVDAAVARLREAASPLADADASWRLSFARADDALRQLPGIRTAVPAGVLNPNTVIGNYDRAIEALLSLLAEPSPGVEHPELNDAVLRYVQLARVTDIGSQIRGQLYSAARADRYGPDDLVRLSDLRAQQFAALAEFRVAATADQVQRYERASARPEFLAATRLEEGTIALNGREPAILDPENWWAVSGQRIGLLQQVESTVLTDAVDQADRASATQLRRTVLVAGGVLAVLLIAVLTSVVIGRSLARSLNKLRRQAIQVAQIELPDALERLRAVDPSGAEIEVSPAVIRSMDEIGEVAEAFVAVHRSAVALAVEQAQMRSTVNAMFVNLARRSQVLVERQLELLDDLEREESDPDQLDNLFKLDHLAARMRRNDDSLLVLAGTESSRRWTQAAPLPAVMLAAVAEVEQYQRIRHDATDQLFVVGHAVADLVHLLAELLENASSFSPPEFPVLISGRADGSGGAVIDIVDDGLGMSHTALAEANEVLARPPAADVAASQRMGLFVVSHLAARQGIRVSLRAVEHGVVATVRLPAPIMTDEPSQAIDQRPTLRMLAALAAGEQPAVDSGAPARPGASEWAVRPSAADLPFAGQLPVAGQRPFIADEQRADLPVAGRRPGRTTSPRRPVPTRAEDVLPQAGGDAGDGGSTWWSRQGRPPGGARRPAQGGAAPVAGVTGWLTGAGVPTLAGPAAQPTPAAGPAGSASPAGSATPDGSPPGGSPGWAGSPADRPPAVKANGLPVRVPMAHLPAVTESATPRVPTPRVDPDPEATGGMLSRFYGGVRRAEEEEITTEISMSSYGVGGEEEMQ